MGISQRRKGHGFERDIARDLTARCGVRVRRGFQSRGPTEPDVCIDGWWLECKRGKRTPMLRGLKQAIDDELAARGDGSPRVPAAICKDDREAAVVVMLYEDWASIVFGAHREREDNEQR